MVKTVGILVPTAKPKIARIPINPRFNDLDGKAMGFLWDEKPNGDILLRRISEDLSRRYRLAKTDWGQAGGKDFQETLMTPIINQLAASSDTIVIGVGD